MFLIRLLAGKSSVLTAPNGLAQQNAIATARARASNVTTRCFESHGTGTKLGDPIEVSAIVAVAHGTHGKSLQLGAVKTQLGHLEAAAGAVGLVKAVTVLEARTLISNLHFNVLNSNIASPSELLLPTTVLPQHGALGVSSFGMSGTNAHAVLTLSNTLCGESKQQQVLQYHHTPFIWWLPATRTEVTPLLGVSTAALEADNRSIIGNCILSTPVA